MGFPVAGCFTPAAVFPSNFRGNQVAAVTPSTALLYIEQ
jgi:hypothetical protein